MGSFFEKLIQKELKDLTEGYVRGKLTDFHKIFFLIHNSIR